MTVDLEQVFRWRKLVTRGGLAPVHADIVLDDFEETLKDLATARAELEAKEDARRSLHRQLITMRAERDEARAELGLWLW